MKLSIIVPVYNAESYLRSAIDSLLAQTFTDWEAICVDDGSTDASGQILDEYALHDNRIKVVHQENAKVHSARNHGLELATGDWIGFLDPDDIVAPRWLEVAMGAAVKTDKEVDLIRLSYSRNANIHWNELPEVPKEMYIADLHKWGWSVFLKAGFLWLCFIKRDCIKHLRFKGGINCKEDSIFLLEALQKVTEAVQVEYPGYFYRTVEGSLSNNKKTHVMQVVSYINALMDVYKQGEPQLKRLGLSCDVVDMVCANAISDICSWALKLDYSERYEYEKVRQAWMSFKMSVCPATVCLNNLTLRIRPLFKLWEITGWIMPLSLMCKLYLQIGDALRRLGLRKGINNA